MAKRLYYQALERLDRVVAEAPKRPRSGTKSVTTLRRFARPRILKPKQVSGFSFGPDDLRKFANGFYVYLWKRGDEVLYVGSTKNVPYRIATHHAVGVREPFGEWDRIEVRAYGSASEMLATELALIRKLRPRHNIANVIESQPKPEPKQKYRKSGPTTKTRWIASCLARANELREEERARA